MPRKSLRCLVELDIHALTSPGTWLQKHDDIYLSVSLFGQIRRTRYVSSVFPLLLHDKLKFDKVFYTAYEPSQVALSLEDLTMRIELIQLSDLYAGGRMLAWYESNVRDFLYPYPNYSPSYGIHDRELLMERSLYFPGISPRLEFSSKTVIQETLTPLLDPWDLDEEVAEISSNGHRSRSRSRSPTRQVTYRRPTISSITRSRSVSPAMRGKLNDMSLDEDSRDGSGPVPIEDRPPFVVRKVGPELIGRMPVTHNARSRSLDKRRKSLPSGDYNTYLNDYIKSYDYQPRSARLKKSRESLYSSYDRNGLSDTDNDYYYRPRSVSPFRSTLRDRHDERPWSPTRSELIRDRIDRALKRNKSLERLDRLGTYRGYRSTYDTDSLDELELDFQRARREKYYY